MAILHGILRAALSTGKWLAWAPRVELKLGSCMVVDHMGGLCSHAFGLSWFRHVRIRELLLPLTHIANLRDSHVPSRAKPAPAAVAALYGLHIP